ncbi:M20 family peptidase [Nibrella saemangeumensis]|uniref:M20 family peptidase n=1 Tax=Nibrella saemangeumensis TaxID=1084526 RepID=A0ABP8MBV5_9BACT
MKRLLRLLLSALLLLIVTLILRTLFFTSRQLTNVPPAPAVAVSDSAVTRLAQALRIRTVSYADYSLTDTTQFDQFVRFLERSYPLVHSRLKRETFNQYGLLYQWPGRNPTLKPVLLMGHYDVVPVIQGTERMWKRPPFAGLIENGYIYGRGTLDDKTTVLGILEATEFLLQSGFQPERTIYLAFGQDEEASGNRGARTIANALKSRNITFDYVLDEGGTIKTDGMPGLTRPVALVGIAEKGYVSLELSAVGQGGHSSMPPPRTSIGLVADAVATLEKHPFPARLDAGANHLFSYIGPEMPFGQRLVFANRWLFSPIVKNILAGANSSNAMIRTTTAPTIFQAGVKDNVLPIDAKAILNFRILPGETPTSVIERVREVIDNEAITVTEFGQFSSSPSPLSDPNAPAFQRLHQTIRSVFPEVIVAPYLMLGATDARYFTGLSPNVYRFLPTRLNDEEIKSIHGTNERISISDYKKIIQFYATLIRNS